MTKIRKNIESNQRSYFRDIPAFSAPFGPAADLSGDDRVIYPWLGGQLNEPYPAQPEVKAKADGRRRISLDSRGFGKYDL